MIPPEVTDMPDYQKMYHLLFNAITDALTLFEQGKLTAAQELLCQAQNKAEEIYIEASEQKD